MNTISSILTIKIDISYGKSFLTEFSIAPKLQMDSIFPFKKKNIVAKLTKTSSEEFSLVGDHRCTPGPFITSKEFGVLD